MRRYTLLIVVAVLLAYGEWSAPAYAYLDPGTGSMVIQAVVAGAVGALALVRLYWSRLKGIVKRDPPKDANGR
jgi:hypothetical protein